MIVCVHVKVSRAVSNRGERTSSGETAKSCVRDRFDRILRIDCLGSVLARLRERSIDESHPFDDFWNPLVPLIFRQCFSEVPQV